MVSSLYPFINSVMWEMQEAFPSAALGKACYLPCILSWHLLPVNWGSRRGYHVGKI